MEVVLNYFFGQTPTTSTSTNTKNPNSTTNKTNQTITSSSTAGRASGWTPEMDNPFESTVGPAFSALSANTANTGLQASTLTNDVYRINGNLTPENANSPTEGGQPATGYQTIANIAYFASRLSLSKLFNDDQK